VHSTNLLAKVDHTFSNRQQLSVRYSFYDVRSENSRGAGGFSAPSASSRLDNRDQNLAVSNTMSLGSRTLLETRAQLAHGDLQALRSHITGPAVNITTTAAFGRLSTSPTARGNTLYQVASNLSDQAGGHAIRTGVDFLYNDDRIEFPRSVRGTYNFSSLANFLSGTYNTGGFTETFGAAVAQTNPNLGLYVQDEWKITRAVTMNLGMRYDAQWIEIIRVNFPG
jgi:outer membrane receptor for monomeric catechols